MNSEEAKSEALRLARAILDRQMELVPGCRAIQRPLALLGLRTDSDFTIFISVDSEADQFPIGDERQHWNPQVLKEIDPRIAEFNAHYRPYVEQACRTLIAHLTQ